MSSTAITSVKCTPSGKGSPGNAIKQAIMQRASFSHQGIKQQVQSFQVNGRVPGKKEALPWKADITSRRLPDAFPPLLRLFPLFLSRRFTCVGFPPRVQSSFLSLDPPNIEDPNE